MRADIRAGILLAAAVALFGAGCNPFPRMRDQASLKPYERDMPRMPANLVPASGGDYLPGTAEARKLTNPLEPSAEAVEAGKTYYSYYCRHCHGDKGDSRTPVGDSYVPKPTHLHSARVQAMADGELYRAMVAGRGHEPVMKGTVPPERRWAIVHFIRTLKQ